MQREDIHFSSDPQGMAWHALIEARLMPLARAAGCNDMEVFGLQLALVEAVNNIVEHAYRLTPGQPISVGCECTPAALRFELRDEGMPMPLPLPSGEPAPAEADGGRGWQIIRAGFPDIHYERVDGVNRLTLIRPLPTAV
ncbi:ATP-binding protein [Thiohalocapsa sp. ML1]|jgi:serine/threonine-protein kinase RsbW|uniref:ATP-binding protein n=1 Tax=Thiohalocapsa sp. ML1 TaxID=1431688 RepID=UPI00073205BE|nr:ATP-binding protein [Thiohalocapsa sp. ML1]